MGRAKGEAARIKSRPSSSSLAASLLPSCAAAVGFGGYVGDSPVNCLLASTSNVAPFTDIGSEAAHHLKRLSRKDPTTKLKALTSLCQLIKQKTAKEIAIIIPQWAFEYKKLLLDYNREVRRETHGTMTYLVSAVGRDLAPHLKLLIGPWWFSQFDSVYEVSQAAKQSFQEPSPMKNEKPFWSMTGMDTMFLCPLGKTSTSSKVKTKPDSKPKRSDPMSVASTLCPLPTVIITSPAPSFLLCSRS